MKLIQVINTFAHKLNQ